VHLAIPKQTAFLRDEQKPTASVMVNLHRPRLDQAQIAGIVHLISSSVPNLTNDNVSVIDQDGSLLTKKPDPLRTSLDATQIKYTRELEEGYIERINAILTPLFGKGNFRAQVSADVDFNVTEQTAETYRPNPSPEQAIRSQQSSESQTRDQGPQGVPGALTNQPPVPATAPVTTPPVPARPAPGQQPPLTTSKNATINYEVDKTIQHTRKALGQVRRLSVAVAVNQREEKDKSGALKPSRSTTSASASRSWSATRSATTRRGATPSASPAAPSSPDKDLETPIWKDPEPGPVQGTHQVPGHRRRDRLRGLRRDPAAAEAGHAPARTQGRRGRRRSRGQGRRGGRRRRGRRRGRRRRGRTRPKQQRASPTKRNSPRCSNSPGTTRRCSAT
jgi:flagellar M-ring protein FliF